MGQDEGEEGGCPSLTLPLPAIHSDVDDVAAAHVLAMLDPAASGRYIASAQSGVMLDWIRELAPQFPACRFPIFPLPKHLLWLASKLGGPVSWDAIKSTVGKLPKIDSSRAQCELGLRWQSPKAALADMVRAMLAEQKHAVGIYSATRKAC